MNIDRDTNIICVPSDATLAVRASLHVCFAICVMRAKRCLAKALDGDLWSILFECQELARGMSSDESSDSVGRLQHAQNLFNEAATTRASSISEARWR